MTDDRIKTSISELTPLVGMSARRIEYGTPTAYRLARRSICGVTELVLQGAYAWTEGSNGGIEWRDIPIVDLEPPA